MASRFCFGLVVVALAGAIMAACGGDNPVHPTPGCPPDRFADVVPADTGWRSRIQAQAASVPGDTLLQAIVAYRDSVTAADRAALQAGGATITYEFEGFPALSISVTAGELLELTAAGPLSDSRVQYAELGMPICVAQAHPS